MEFVGNLKRRQNRNPQRINRHSAVRNFSHSAVYIIREFLNIGRVVIASDRVGLIVYLDFDRVPGRVFHILFVQRIGHLWIDNCDGVQHRFHFEFDRVALAQKALYLGF